MKFFWLMFMQYFLVVANTRAYTQGNYMWTAVTDIIFCSVGFTLTKKIADSKSKFDLFWYVVGGTAGAQVAIFVSKLVYGK